MTAVPGKPKQSSGSNKAQLAYDFIKNHIVAGRYTPGYRLVLSTLANELGVSVVPVREAIRRLEAERLVTFERNVGAQVAMLDEREYLYTMQTLALVEGYATALSAPLITPEQIRHAREINERMRQSLTHFQPHEFTEQNFAFHSVLFENCPNPHVLDLVQRGWTRLANLRDSTFSFVPGRAQSSVEEHEQLLRLIEAGAGVDAVEKAAREHRTHTLDAFLARQGGRLLDDD